MSVKLRIKELLILVLATSPRNDQRPSRASFNGDQFPDVRADDGSHLLPKIRRHQLHQSNTWLSANRGAVAIWQPTRVSLHLTHVSRFRKAGNQNDEEHSRYRQRQIRCFPHRRRFLANRDSWSRLRD
jgi:hypothetical protein